MQAAAQMGLQQSGAYAPVSLPALYNQQMQQAMAMWGPYLALYQMQAMMGGAVGGGPMYPPPPVSAAADPFMQQAQHAQHAQQAFMMAMQQVAAVSGPGAVPQSLGIAMGTGAAHQQSPQLASALLASATAPLAQGTELCFLCCTVSSNDPAAACPCAFTLLAM